MMSKDCTISHAIYVKPSTKHGGVLIALDNTTEAFHRRVAEFSRSYTWLRTMNARLLTRGMSLVES